MNDLGMVVGNLFTGAPSYTYSVFIYNGVMHDLNTLVDGGWKITTVGKINNFGQIALLVPSLVPQRPTRSY
jgi:hypothetical protein